MYDKEVERILHEVQLRTYLVPYQQRMVIEALELRSRLYSLCTFIQGQKEANGLNGNPVAMPFKPVESLIDASELSLMVAQSTWMKRYLGVLAKRIERFK